MKKEAFVQLVKRRNGFADRTETKAIWNYGYKAIFFVDPAKVTTLRDGLLPNSFTCYLVRNDNGTWDAIEETTGLSCRPHYVDVRVCTYDEIHDAIAQYKEFIFDRLVCAEKHLLGEGYEEGYKIIERAKRMVEEFRKKNANK